MFVYILNFILVIFWGILLNRNKNIALAAVFIQLLLILVARSETGYTDIPLYKFCYEFWPRYSFREMFRTTRIIEFQAIPYGFESGYTWLCWVCAKIGLSFRGFLIIHAMICVASLYRFAREYCLENWVSVVLIIVFGPFRVFFFILRQALACSILLFAVNPIKNRNFLKFILLVLCGTLFHTSAVLLLPLYFLYPINVSPFRIVLVMIGAVAFSILIPIMRRVLEIILLTTRGQSEYLSRASRWNNLVLLYALFVFLVLIMTYKEPEFFKKKDHKLQFWALAIALYLQVFALSVPTLARALSLVSTFAIPILGDTVLAQKHASNRRILSLVFCFGAFAYHIYSLRGSDLDPYLPFWR